MHSATFAVVDLAWLPQTPGSVLLAIVFLVKLAIGIRGGHTAAANGRNARLDHGRLSAPISRPLLYLMSAITARPATAGRCGVDPAPHDWLHDVRRLKSAYNWNSLEADSNRSPNCANGRSGCHDSRPVNRIGTLRLTRSTSSKRLLRRRRSSPPARSIRAYILGDGGEADRWPTP